VDVHEWAADVMVEEFSEQGSFDFVCPFASEWTNSAQDDNAYEV
jgi:hypothetical protein